MRRATSDSGLGDGEPLVNPYSLVQAVNAASDSAHVAWLIFLGLMAYLMVAVAGVTHKDLLLETPVALPILQVSLPQAQFFQFAPVVLVLLHVGLVAQLILVAKKAIEFDSAVRLLEAGQRRSHPLRLELHNFFFVQAIAGPHRSRILSAMLHAISWLTLVVLPVLLILFVQLRYLPFHDVGATWGHRAVLVADMVMLTLIGVFLARSEASFFDAFRNNTADRPVTAAITGALLIVVAAFSFLIATIPDEWLDRTTMSWLPRESPKPDRFGRVHMGGFAIPVVSRSADGTLFGIFHRNLIATDLDLVPTRDRTLQETSISLRGRDLRFARLDRTDLHQADFTLARLDGASLRDADLRGIKMRCIDLGTVIARDVREADNCASAVGASFDGARLEDARLSGSDLKGARFVGAKLRGANLAATDLTAAAFTGADLDGADLSGGARLVGADLTAASLRGADLKGAWLQGALLAGAQMQAAVLRSAQLQASDLTSADLEGADLTQTRLEAARLQGARLRSADLRGAQVWMTVPPDDWAPFMDVTDVRIRPLGEGDAGIFSAAIARLPTEAARARVQDLVTPLLAIASSRGWSSTSDGLRWQAIVTKGQPSLGEAHPRELTDALVQLMCKPRWVGGAVAVGVVRRALGTHFRGSASTVHERARADDCPASKAIPPALMGDLVTLIDTQRSN